MVRQSAEDIEAGALTNSFVYFERYVTMMAASLLDHDRQCAPRSGRLLLRRFRILTAVRRCLISLVHFGLFAADGFVVGLVVGALISERSRVGDACGGAAPLGTYQSSVVGVSR